jgi:hypothetical protein
MSKLGAVFLTTAMLAANVQIPVANAAEEAPHLITQSSAWGCRDKGDLFNLLFAGISASFDTQLATALADGRCVYFAPGESVTVLEQGAHGVVKVQRGGASPVTYWTTSRNVR